jgi:hypothetical protein
LRSASLKAEADKIIAQTDDATAARAARDGIRDQVLNQLNEVNRFSSQVNRPHAELMADYYTTMAQRAGMTPEQFMQTYALQYRSDATGGADKTLQQDTIAASGAPHGDQLSTGPGAGELQQSGRVRGSDGLLAEPRGPSDGNAGRDADGSLNGLPRKVGSVTASVFKPAADVAQRYMADRGETYSPPSNYVKVDPARATRIADAFEAMEHDPRNPKVKAAYDAMISETVAQYEAMLKTGIKIEFAPKDTDPYNDNPRNMTEDVRNNNHMWVFGTRDGFGSDATFDPSENPLLAETGHTISGQTALANDLFRAVHDYFGHVKEGVGFRADGEENAWRAHAAMYSDVARKAATTETRGQNSWLNYGPYGETNRTAKVGDTHFADQKIGLLPDWVMEEGRTDNTLDQPARGQIAFGDDITKQPSIISMFKGADLSTFLHESGHFFLEVQSDLARKIEARIAAGADVGPGERSIADDMATSLDWLGVKASDGKTALDKWDAMTLDEKRELHEKWARGFETYAMEGTAPSVGLARAFQTFSNWLTHIYKTLANLHAELTPEVRGVFDRMLASQDAIQTAEAVRGYKSLFETADAAGMTPEAFAEYQKLGQQSTSDAIATMQARSLRDMQWLSNAKSRALKDLQAKANAARKDMREQVTKEVDATPAFAAKRFLVEATDPLAGYKSDMADWRAKRNEVPKGGLFGLSEDLSRLWDPYQPAAHLTAHPCASRA